MSVLIKGMAMPKNCGECFIGNRTICHHKCPLVEAQTLHGRLINGDELVGILENAHPKNELVRFIYEDIVDAIKTIVNKLPEIILQNDEKQTNSEKESIPVEWIEKYIANLRTSRDMCEYKTEAYREWDKLIESVEEMVEDWEYVKHR